ncbi:MAG TPA: hypothetical protein PLT70_08675, partial [bacterium]|nr:hypothetical protein [bacterium]
MKSLIIVTLLLFSFLTPDVLTKMVDAVYIPDPVIVVEGNGIMGGKTAITGDVSSQFISGLMFACPMAQKETEITITTPLESKDYVKMTQEILAQHKVKIEISNDFKRIRIPAKQTYKQADGKVPGDFSSAAFLLAAAAITESNVTIGNLQYETFQGDK